MVERLLIGLMIALLGAALPPASAAPAFLTSPVIRVETGMHTGIIDSVATDAANRFIVTGGRDKVARVWSLPDLEPLQVLRPPIGNGDEGTVMSVAVTPAGDLIAVSGVFCRYEQSFCIFIFDRASGRIVKRLAGFGNIVRKVEWSPDGTLLAAGLAGKGGVRVLRASDWKEIGRDTDYADFVSAMSFGGGSQLAVASWDGKVRIYSYSDSGLVLKRAKMAADFNHTVYRNAQNRGRPSTIAFSPDGSKLAVGHTFSGNWVIVLSTDTLDSLYMPSTVGLSNNIGGFGLRRLAWSADGNTLFGGVASNNKMAHFVRIWRDGGRATPSDVALPGLQPVGDLAVMKNGGLVFTTGMLLGVIDDKGSKQQVLATDGGNFYGTHDAFRVSRDGTRIQFAYDEGREVFNFDVLERRLAAGPVKDVPVAAPETNTRNIKFYNQWRDTRGALSFNGQLMQMEGFSRALSIAPDESAIAVGTDARLYLYNADGTHKWNAQIGGNLAVNLSADNRLVVSAHNDGAVRWYRRSDGRLLLTLFVAADRKRWALVSPSGFYDTSVGGEDLLGWHVNREREEAADFFPISRLRARFYNPSVIADIIRNASDDDAFKRAAAALIADAAPRAGVTPPPTPPAATAKPVTAAPVPKPAEPAPKVAVTEVPPAPKPAAPAPKVAVTEPSPAPKPAIVAQKPPAPKPAAVAPEEIDTTEQPAQSDAPAAVQVVTDITRVLPPVVTVLSPATGSTANTNTVTIRYSVKTNPDAPVTSIRTRVNGIGRDTSQARALAAAATREVEVEIPSEDSEILLFAENRFGMSMPASVRLKWTGAKPQPVDARPTLYVLSIGVSEYIDPENRLKFAAKDAIDFASTVAKQKGRLYRDVVVKLLTDKAAGRDDVIAGFEWLQKQVTPKDVGIVLIAGHGVNDERGNYYYLPVNADAEKLSTTAVPFNLIKTHLAALHGKGLLFVDTCHSGNVMGKRRNLSTDTTAMLNELASPEYGLVVIASSTGKQYSFENAEWGNGAFTKALVEGLSGRADLKKRGRITHKMLDFYVSDRVEELTQGKQTPVNTSPLGVPDYTIAVSGG